MVEIISQMEAAVKVIEKQLSELTKDDQMVNRLLTIRGCGKITAWTIRAYTEDISRFSSAKKYAAFCGLVPWVSDSNETIRHGKVTKRGPQELRVSFVQMVMGIRRCKDTANWRIMQRYDYMKTHKGSINPLLLLRESWQRLSGRCSAITMILTERRCTVNINRLLLLFNRICH